MINVEGVSKRFDDFAALDDVTCNIQTAAFMAWLVPMVRENQHFCGCFQVFIKRTADMHFWME